MQTLVTPSHSLDIRQRGFTIVELLIVVVVIAILAAITVVAYNGITKRTVDSSMKADLHNIATIAEMDKTNNGAYASSATLANGGKGLRTSGDNQLDYVATGSNFCVSISNPKATSTLRFKSLDGRVTDGICGAVVSTLSGSGAQGFADGAGATARFDVPNGIAVDATGTVYVADTGNSRIRKITPDGVVSTLAGTGEYNIADGPGATAMFTTPYGVAVNASGTVYVADASSNRIRAITPGGVVSTLAGGTLMGPSSGFVDGVGAVVRFNQPTGIAVDAAGVVYVADTFNHSIRKITPGGVVSTLAKGQFSSPSGVAVDSAGMVYVADKNNHRIAKITPDGVVSTLAGSGVYGFMNGTGATAQFASPSGVAVDATGTVYVADTDNHRIRSVSPNGDVTTLAGMYGNGFIDGLGATAQFNNPSGITVNASGVVYVGDRWNHRIRVISQ